MLRYMTTWARICGIRALVLAAIVVATVSILGCHAGERAGSAGTSHDFVVSPDMTSPNPQSQMSIQSDDGSPRTAENPEAITVSERQVSYLRIETEPSLTEGEFQPICLANDNVQGQEPKGDGSEGASVGFPLFRDPQNAWTVSGNLGHEHADGYPDGQEAAPEQWKVATQYGHRFANGWIGGGVMNLAVPAEKPGDIIGNMTAEGDCFIKLPQGSPGSWLFRLGYLRSSERGLPIARIEYVGQLSNPWQGILDLDFPLTSDLADGLSLEMSFIVLWPTHP